MKKIQIGAVLCFFTALIFLVFFYPGTNPSVVGEELSEGKTLPKVDSYENLVKLLQASEGQVAVRFFERNGGAVDTLADSAASAPIPQNEGATKALADSETYSSTNVQVAGVDEGDVVKTDGQYIYTLSQSGDKPCVTIINAQLAEEMQLTSRLTYGEDFYPQDLYLDGDRLIVLGSAAMPIMPLSPLLREESARGYYPPQTPTSKVIVYDIKDKAIPQKVRELEIEGYTLSSRIADHVLYVVANKSIPYYSIYERAEENETPAEVLPAYKDSLAGEEAKRIAFADISYFPGTITANYLLVAALDLNKLSSEQAKITAFLGGGQNVYASLENLYVTLSEYKSAESGASYQFLENTAIYKLALNKGDIRLTAQGSVPGFVLNQFSMDENGSYFRIATTTREDNNLYILDADLARTGSLEKLAPGEKIYSVRFMGNRAYLVTFKTVDPLFVLDLQDPQNPAVLGYLKIPGYSDYLHPYDENHLIGIGKDALELDGNAYYLGMKLALFDVSDVAHPIEKFKMDIGDRGTESEALRNHKAVLFDREKNLLAFPVTVASNLGLSAQYDHLAARDPRLIYGTPVFQGAYVYELTLEQGFRFKGGISHQKGDLPSLYASGQYDYTQEVRRILYIGDTLFTVSDGKVQANDLKNLNEIGALRLQ